MKLLFLNHVVLQSLGPFKVPLLVVLLIVLGLLIYSVYLKFSKSDADHHNLKKSLNALLVVGSFNLALGMIGQITGIWDMLDAIVEAADINLEIVIQGIKISFITTIFGLATFMIAVIAWVLLTYLPVQRKGLA